MSTGKVDKVRKHIARLRGAWAVLRGRACTQPGCTCQQVATVTSQEAVRALADVVAGQMAGRFAAKSLRAGSGTVWRD